MYIKKANILIEALLLLFVVMMIVLIIKINPIVQLKDVEILLD